MNYKQIIARLTGFSTPIFGVSWNPPETDYRHCATRDCVLGGQAGFL